MANHVFVAVSLDGYIASEDGGIDWLSDIPNPEKSDFGYSAFIGRMDAIVMGRKTFDVVCSFDEWPYGLPVFVLSNLGHRELYLDGGATIRGFLDADLVDEMIITRLPLLLGRGIPLFGNTGNELQFTHVQTEVLAGQLVQTKYTRKRKNETR